MKKRYLEAPRVLLKFAREASCYVEGRELAQKLYRIYSHKVRGDMLTLEQPIRTPYLKEHIPEPILIIYQLKRRKFNNCTSACRVYFPTYQSQNT